MNAKQGKVVAIIGGGASGTITAAHLLRHAPSVARIVLIDRTDHGPGVAYSTEDPQHLLNVRASGISAFDNDPDDLLRWCARSGIPARAADFLPRRVYGDYLRSLLVRFGEPGRLELVVGVATTVTPLARALRVEIEGRLPVTADAVVLALGNPPPSPTPGVVGDVRCVVDPWSPGAIDELGRASRIAVIGTGMTAVDVILSATARNPGTRISAISRHGRLPQAHLAAAGTAAGSAPHAAVQAGEAQPRPAGDLATAMRRALAVDVPDWRAAIDALRPHTQQLWQAMTLPERRHFLDQHKSRWDTHRHRMAPPVAARIDALLRTGQLRVLSGSLDSATANGRGIALSIRRGELSAVEHADLVVNATGPSRRIAEIDDPLIRGLLASGRAMPDDLGIGLACDADGGLIDVTGEANEHVFAIGPPRRGELFESTAIPEIRAQAARIAGRLASQTAAVTPLEVAGPQAGGQGIPVTIANGQPTQVAAARRRSAIGHFAKGVTGVSTSQVHRETDRAREHETA